jgi:hypothetical protein
VGCGEVEGGHTGEQTHCIIIRTGYCSWKGEQDSAGIFKQSMEARNRVGIGLSYRPARLHRLAEFIPWTRFLGSIDV